MSTLGWSDAALVFLFGGLWGYVLGVVTTMAWCIARVKYWKNRSKRMRARWGEAAARCALLQRQGE